MAIKPLGDRVVVKKIEAEDKTSSGIILAGQAKEDPHMAKVLAVAKDDMQVKVGDTVLLPKYAGTEVKVDGDTVTIIEEESLLAIVE